MDNVIAPLKQWWSSITQREQQLVLVCSVLIIVGGIYWGMVQPLAQRSEQAQQRIKSEQQLLTWVQNKANEIITLRGSGGAINTSQPLNQTISSSARRYNVDLIRVQPRGEMIQVWIQPMDFNRFVDWLAYLQDQQGVSVEFMDIDRGERSGVVEVKRLQFKRG